MKILKVTPNLIVDQIEPSLALYTALGFAQIVGVPHGDRLGFVLLAREEAAVMLQTRASLKEDLPSVLARGVTSLLYVDVDSLEAALESVKGAEILVPPRTTFYGAREAYVAEPSGQILGFAEHVAPAAS